MSTVREIIEDINVSITDIETLKLDNPNSEDLKRAVGQIKAARASLVSFRGENAEVTK
jgi:hypothetical protein